MNTPPTTARAATSTPAFATAAEMADATRAKVISASELLISVGGAWLTARLAPNEPMKHALFLGYVGVVLGLVGIAATWNLGLGPRWYPVALAVLAIPQCWLGGRMYEMHRVSSSPRQTARAE